MCNDSDERAARLAALRARLGIERQALAVNFETLYRRLQGIEALEAQIADLERADRLAPLRTALAHVGHPDYAAATWQDEGQDE